jgi:AcrR family transcriptional regulator
MTGFPPCDQDGRLAAFLEVFLRKGLSGTTLRDLAEAADFPEQLLRETYGNPQTVFLAAFDPYAARLVEAVERALDQPGIRAALTAFFDIAIASMTDSARKEECLTTRATLDPALGERVRQRMVTLLDRLEIRLTALFERQESQARLTLSPSQAAIVVMTFTRGLAVMESAYRDPVRLREAAEAIVCALCGEN